MRLHRLVPLVALAGVGCHDFSKLVVQGPIDGGGGTAGAVTGGNAGGPSDTGAPDGATGVDSAVTPGALTVKTILPTDQGKDFEPGGSIMIVFSAPLASGSTASTVHLRQGTTAVELDISASGDTVKLTPKQPLALRTSYTVELDDLIQDVEHHNLTGPRKFTFSTRDGQWRALTVNWGNNPPTGQAELAMNAAGNAVVLFPAMGSLFSVPFAIHYDARVPSWRGPFLLPVSTNAAYAVGGVALDDMDRACATWVVNSGFDRAVYTARVPGPSSSWVTAALTKIPAELPSYSRVAMIEGGKCWVVWSGLVLGSPNTHPVQQHLMDVSTGFASTSQVPMTGANEANFPELAAGATDVVLAWEQKDETRINVHASDGASTGSTATLSDGVADAHAPAVAMDWDGNAFAVWQQQSMDGYIDVVASRRPKGGSWTAPVRVSDGKNSTSNPAIAVAGNRTFITVWQQLMGGRKQVFASRWVMNVGWSPTPSLLSNGMDDATAPRVVLDATGNAVAMWQQGPVGSKTPDVWAARYVAGEDWQAAARLSDAGVVSSEPRVALDRRGRGLAIWRQGTATIVQRFE